jgi:long-chain acyl-CoA synthetase
MAQTMGVERESGLLQGRTIGRLWLDAVNANRRSPAYLVERDGAWEEVSWQQAAQVVDELAHGLLAAGIGKGDAFAILGQTTLEWALFDFALSLVGAIGVPIYANSSTKDARFVAAHSEAVGVLCEDSEQLAKLEPLGLERTWSFADLDELRARGRAHADEQPKAVLDAAAEVDEDDLFTYIYTSGTTGPPKACMIRHRNYYEMVAVVDQLERLTMQDDLLLLYLPLAHNFGRLMHLAGPYVGFTVAFLPDPLRTADALLQVRPTVLPSVPRVYEKVHAGVLAKFDEETGLKAAHRRLGAARRLPRKHRATARRASPCRPRAPATAGAQARLLEGADAPGREAAHRRLGRRPARPRHCRVLRRARNHDPGGVRPHRVHVGGDREPRREVPPGHRRPGASRNRATPGR